MADVYRANAFSGGNEKRSRGVFGILFEILISLISIVTIVSMVATYMAPYISPQIFWVFSIMGLVAPATYILTLVLMLYWLIKWRLIWVSIFVVVLALGFLDVSLFYKSEFAKEYDVKSRASRGVIKIMSYNVRSFYGEDGQSSVGDILDLVGEEDPDIICFQEFSYGLLKKSGDSLAILSDYHSAVGRGKLRLESVKDASVVIFSKYKVLGSGYALADSVSKSYKRAIWADLLVDDDTIRVFNNHLQSTTITSKDDEFITKHQYITDSVSDVKIKSMVYRFKESSIIRSRQADAISEVLDGTNHDKIVCGDFNDTPMSYVYRVMSGDLQDAFSEKGRGFSHTYNGFFDILRIDYILLSERLSVESYDVVGPLNYSDHLPLFVKFKIDKK